MVFASREDAGHRLGRYLQDQGVEPHLVLGLPRGGVVVGSAVARALGTPLDVLIVRKIGHPSFREFAVGALAENGVIVLDENAVGKTRLARSELDEVVEEEMDRLAAYESRFHSGDRPDLRDKTVLLVDDGLATGSTMEAAALSARSKGAARVIVAVPVASTGGVQRLERVADQVKALLVDPDFDAVGRYYDVFLQTTDEEVLALLRADAHRGT